MQKDENSLKTKSFEPKDNFKLRNSIRIQQRKPS